MEETNSINICVSGWSGSGSTTLSLLLANLLERQYFNNGQVFRALGEKLGFSDEGRARPEFDDYVEDIIGRTVDNYTDYKLLNASNIIFEGDLGAFRIGKHPKVFSIFLITEKKNRIERAVADGRQDAELILEKRDSLLKKKYNELWNIDYFDESLIEKKYNLKFDNTNMPLDIELRQILDELRKYNYFTYVENNKWQIIYDKINPLVELFLKQGKTVLINNLKKKNLYIEPKLIMQDIAKTFPEDITQYPENIKNIFLGISK